MSEYPRLQYTIKPERFKTSFSTEYWNKTFKNKNIKVAITIMWRNSSFNVWLTEEEKTKIINDKEIIISDYDFQLNDLYDFCDIFFEIENENKYTKKLIKEINISLFGTEEYNEGSNFSELMIENNGWVLEDTIYKIKDNISFE